MITATPEPLNGGFASRNRTAIILVLLLAAASYFASPFIVLWQIQSAVKANDADAITSLVDFTQVRDAIKNSLHSAMTDALGEYAKNAKNDPNPFAAAGAGLRMLIAGPMIDSAVATYVTPQGLIKALGSGKAPDLSSAMSSSFASSSSSLSNATSNSPQMDFHYVSADRFAVNVRPPNTAHIETRLCRVNVFGWKLCSMSVANLVPKTGSN